MNQMPASKDAFEQGTSPDAVPAPSSNHTLITLSWSAVAILLAFLLLAQAGVLLCFAAGLRVSPFVAPAALLLSLAAGDWLARREGLRGWLRIAPPALALAILGVSLALSAAFFDLSWDGQWYHQTAIYQMAHGWNPLRDPMRAFEPSLQDYVRHYSKGAWYDALALFQTTGHMEWAKPAPWISLAAMFLAVAAALLEFGMSRRKTILIATLVSLNPVVVCELATYQVDGLWISFLACWVAAAAVSFRRSGGVPLLNGVAVTSAALCINSKFSALVMLCFFCAAGGVYLLIRRRRMLLRWASLQLVVILFAAVVFGFNPYVTNTIHRGHPFYPWMGSAAWPSYADRGQDPNEKWETPANMVGRNRFVRFSYGLFGRPGAQPFYPGKNASLMWPFDVRWSDFEMFYFLDVRIAGFGPLFSGAFLIALALIAAALIRPGLPREIVVLLSAAVVVSVLSGLHMWWARYAPQLWWLPIIAVIAGLAVPDWRAIRWAAGGLAALLMINALLVGFVHFRWEVKSTRAVSGQIAFLRQKSEVEVNIPYFHEPVAERLRAAGVTFHESRRLHCAQPMELMSVPKGYPGQIRACVP